MLPPMAPDHPEPPWAASSSANFFSTTLIIAVSIVALALPTLPAGAASSLGCTSTRVYQSTAVMQFKSCPSN